MKIGIITIHKSPNYGGSLQSYALCNYLSSLAFECEVIDLYRPAIQGYKPSPSYPELIPQRLRKNSFAGRLKKYVNDFRDRHFEKVFNSQLHQKSERFTDFWNKTKFSCPYHSIDELYDNPPIYDIYLTGSDQVWNPTIGFNIEPYFLTFAPQNSQRVSYASSIGLSSIPTHLYEFYRQWLKQYGAIGVRENQAKEIITKLLPEKKVEVVCDPTLLISSEEWLSMAQKPTLSEYILCFTLSYKPELYKYAYGIAQSRKKKLVIFSHGYQDEQIKYATKVYDAGPCEWIGWIKYSDMVITDSFHCTIFSMHCRKHFLTYIAPTNKRGSRIVNLLGIVDLSSHIIRDLHVANSSEPCDYNEVWNKLNTVINHSKQYLIKSLSQHE